LRSRKIAFTLAFLASLFYGVGFTIAKDVMPQYVKPYGFILLRVLGTTLLFWISGLLIKREKIDFQDFLRIFLASVFGIALNMLTFFKGLSMTTPISAAVIMVTTPIFVLSFSALLIREKTSKAKIFGIFIGMAGALLLILYGREHDRSGSNAWGNFLVFINAASYSLYLILTRSLTQKYNPITLSKWIYLFGLFMVIPFGLEEANQINWTELPLDILLKIGYVVVVITFITYLFNIFAIRKLKATTLSIFIYLQPVIASFYAILVGSDSLNEIKIIASLLIFFGVYLVTRQTKEELS
jgi:drug/metabolite transporter (DMT)-like permease